MSYDITNEHGDGDQVATTTGWNEFCDWVDGLDIDDYLEVKHLAQHGWERDLPDLKDQLVKARQEAKPDPDVDSIVFGIIKFIATHPSEIIMISNGQEPDDSLLS
jgi:hypothetical protein